ncbi:MAG: DEAD/DEAH box helicase family protein [Candidatus Micrarchaeota archaeon]|nr:DEAD/DEAH box helicase family protein [Candidatus Micrarchaeota archaeon]MCX8154422.1 DEAD/DEAH box helicase family protein [Candidatus Micrarchaeota archaeon]
MIELREYQKTIISNALKYNTLVVLPTGLGKTLIAFHVMQRYKKSLFLAPTKPLVEQHYRNFSSNFFPDATLATGAIRERNYESRFVFATPQTIMNDIDNIPKDHFEFIVFDEAHRAVGNYDYVKISKYFSSARTLGLTASPGYTREKVLEIINNLRIERIEYRSENDPEILEYLHIKRINNIKVELSDSYRELIEKISKTTSELRGQLERVLKIKLNKYNVEEASRKIQEISDSSRWKIWQDYSKFLTYSHLKELLEIQSIDAGIRYLESLKEEGSRAQSEIVDELIRTLRSYNTSIHPKVQKLLEILRSNQHRQGIVFSQYKAQIFYLSDILTSHNISHDILIGKSHSRTKQMESINRFVNREVNVLLSSSVGEEGLDLPSADYVVFYESIPSPIRVIQRMGRTGRFRDGDVYILITKGTYDERSYNVARKRIRIMYSVLDALKEELMKRTRQNTLFDQI